MRLKLSLALTILLAITPAHAADKSLEGAWELQGGEYVTEDGQTKSYAEMKFNGQKVLADGRFSFTMQSGDKFWAGGAGRYAAGDGQYTETLMQLLSCGGQWRVLVPLSRGRRRLAIGAVEGRKAGRIRGMEEGPALRGGGVSPPP